MSDKKILTVVTESDLLQSTDAALWAKAFVEHVRRIPEIATDEATMLGWFANAIETAKASERRRLHPPLPESLLNGVSREVHTSGVPDVSHRAVFPSASK